MFAESLKLAPTLHLPPEKWLSDMDSNHDKGLQRALCYRYTIGQLVDLQRVTEFMLAIASENVSRTDKKLYSRSSPLASLFLSLTAGRVLHKRKHDMKQTIAS